MLSGDGVKSQVSLSAPQLVCTRVPTLHEGNPVFVPRVLEVEKGQLCFILGTVYMDMSLKPNVLEDIARDVSPLSNHDHD